MGCSTGKRPPSFSQRRSAAASAPFDVLSCASRGGGLRAFSDPINRLSSSLQMRLGEWIWGDRLGSDLAGVATGAIERREPELPSLRRVGRRVQRGPCGRIAPPDHLPGELPRRHTPSPGPVMSWRSRSLLGDRMALHGLGRRRRRSAPIHEIEIEGNRVGVDPTVPQEELVTGQVDCGRQ